MADRNRIPGNLVSEIFQDELRRARNQSGLTQEELAAKITFSSALVAAVETGRRTPSRDFAERCDEALKTGGLLSRMQGRVAQAAAPHWMQEWTWVEQEAIMLRSWESALIPGLLQTQDYAQAILARWPSLTDEEAAQRTAARMNRQAILERDEPPAAFFVIDEGALRREVGGPDVMKIQLGRLLDLTERPTISVQIVPASAGGHVGMSGPYFIASFPTGPDVGYLDTAVAGQLVESRVYLHTMTLLFEQLRGEALPCRASSELVEEVMATWN
jgi:transcriptional regulator with XRE-family HTH domain